MLLVALVLGAAALFISNRKTPTSPMVARQVALTENAINAHVLPFEIIAAIRNFGFKDDLIQAQIAASTSSGGPADWAATAVYIAEHSIVNGSKCSTVEVYVPNPRGDMPPQQPKELAKVSFAPDPAHCAFSNAGDDTWLIQTASRAGTLLEIEFYELSGTLLSDKIDNPDESQELADAQARELIIKKYNLPQTWKADINSLGLVQKFKRDQLDLTIGPEIVAGMQALNTCLENDGDNRLFRGFYPAELRNR